MTLSPESPHASSHGPAQSAAPAITPAPTSPPADTSAVEAPLVAPKPKRTFGLWAVDALIYPLITNVGVFAISVWATYMTQHGDKVDREKNPTYGAITHWFNRRGKMFTKYLEEKWGFSHSSADMSKMVLFSFVDGSFVAPFTKVLEDRREDMAKRIDEIAGTKPQDESVYNAEPKQSWKSVLLGRFAVASIIVPIAATLDSFGMKNGGGIISKSAAAKAGQEFTNFNDRMFTRSGVKLAEKLERSSWPKKLFGKGIDLAYLSKTIVFEAFYTSVCSVGLYFSSRIFARMSGKTIGSAHTVEQPQTNTTEITKSAEQPAIEQPKYAESVAASKATDNIASLDSPKPGYARSATAEEHAVQLLSEKLRKPVAVGDWKQRVAESESDPSLNGFTKA